MGSVLFLASSHLAMKASASDAFLAATPTQATAAYHLNLGATCADGYAPLTSSWQDCKSAAESLGFSGDAIAQVDYVYPFGSDRPQGCFQSDGNRRFHFNAGQGGSFVGSDKILCQKAGYEVAAVGVECADSTQITSSQECESAAAQVGISWNSCCQDIDHDRYGCTYRVSDGDILFNGRVSASATISSNRRAVCKTSTQAPTDAPVQAPTQALYMIISSGTCAELGHQSITNSIDCGEAAQWLRLDDAEASTSNNAEKPTGCYYRSASTTQKLWFNSNGLNNAASTERRLICRHGCADALAEPSWCAGEADQCDNPADAIARKCPCTCNGYNGN